MVERVGRGGNGDAVTVTPYLVSINERPLRKATPTHRAVDFMAAKTSAAEGLSRTRRSARRREAGWAP